MTVLTFVQSYSVTSSLNELVSMIVQIVRGVDFRDGLRTEVRRFEDRMTVGLQGLPNVLRSLEKVRRYADEAAPDVELLRTVVRMLGCVENLHWRLLRVPFEMT